MAALAPTQPSAPMRPSSKRPAFLLSVQLLTTYKKINERFYEAKRKTVNADPGHAEGSSGKKPLHNEGYDDESGNYIVQTGEEISGRYIVQDVLGKGSFGIVVKAHDHRREESVALKIIKNKIQFFHQAKVEIDILTRLNQSASDEHNIVKLKKVFSWKDHICLVFELLSFNLYDLLKYTKFHGVSLNLIRKFAAQILRTLSFLQSQAVGVIHCDLKPENVLLRNPKRSAIKVIDFGSSCYTNKRMYKYIQSRFYRAPEVILGLPYDGAIDIWSLATMLVELHTGQPLFDGKDEAEQLCKFQAVLGPIPQRLIDQSPKRNNFFQWDNKRKMWFLSPPKKDPASFATKSLEQIVNNGRRRDQPNHTEKDYKVFLDLITAMLVYTPKERASPNESLNHEFLSSIPAPGASTAIPGPAPGAVTSPYSQNRTRGHSAGRSLDQSQTRDPRARSRERGTEKVAVGGAPAPVPPATGQPVTSPRQQIFNAGAEPMTHGQAAR